jgi:hypothetical protein
MADQLDHFSSCLRGCHYPHPYDFYRVSEQWWPESTKCLIVGETPGGPSSPYFYDLNQSVRIRRNLLLGLHKNGLIASQTLPAFKEAGFLFDHAIRCKVRPDKRDWQLAKQYLNIAHVEHLKKSLLQFPNVWVMGYIARNAIACADSSFPRIHQDLTQPYVLSGTSKYFVSRYLLYIGDKEILGIACQFKTFLVGK